MQLKVLVVVTITLKLVITNKQTQVIENHNPDIKDQSKSKGPTDILKSNKNKDLIAIIINRKTILAKSMSFQKWTKIL